MDLGIANRNAVVTGGSLGIGLASAHELAGAGVNIALVARQAARVEEAARAINQRYGVRAIGLAADMSDAPQVARAMREAAQRLGAIDILVNNAGSTPAGGLTDLADEVWLQSINLKLLGYMRAARETMPAMKQRGWGRIVNIIGMGAYAGRPNYIAGGVINAGVLALTKALAKDGATDGVTVNGVNPGPVATPRFESLIQQRAQMGGHSIEEERRRSVAPLPMKRPAEPQEIAALVAFLASARASHVNGALIDADGGGGARL